MANDDLTFENGYCIDSPDNSIIDPNWNGTKIQIWSYIPDNSQSWYEPEGTVTVTPAPPKPAAGWQRRLAFVLLCVPALIAWCVLMVLTAISGLISWTAYKDANRLSDPFYNLSLSLVEWMSTLGGIAL